MLLCQHVCCTESVLVRALILCYANTNCDAVSFMTSLFKQTRLQRCCIRDNIQVCSEWCLQHFWTVVMMTLGDGNISPYQVSTRLLPLALM